MVFVREHDFESVKPYLEFSVQTCPHASEYNYEKLCVCACYGSKEEFSNMEACSPQETAPLWKILYPEWE